MSQGYILQGVLWLLFGLASAKVMAPYALTGTGRLLLQLFCILTGPMFLVMWLPNHGKDLDGPKPCPYCKTRASYSGTVYAWLHYDWCPCACVNEESRRILNEPR
jgi:hypothetical protein